MKELLVYDGLTVRPRADQQSIDRLPLLTYEGSNGRLVSNGDPSLGWSWTLFLTLLTQDIDHADDLADTVYQTVHNLGDPFSATYRTTEFGSVVSVDDVSMFDRIATVDLPTRKVTHLSATFTLVVVSA